ncbi:MAG: HEAT repeat domain-containing protein, partial [Anaerolineae bacterium]|nr:HEAT repeat domain-containing protein [Anaerolineae bacterium]
MSDLRPNIWLLQAQGDSKGLIDALQNDDPDVRRRAAAALRMLGAAEAIPALRRALDVEADASTRLHLQLTFEDLIAERRDVDAQQAQAARQLVAQLGSSDPAIIVKAAHALGKLPDKTAVEALVLIFHNT